MADVRFIVSELGYILEVDVLDVRGSRVERMPTAATADTGEPVGGQEVGQVGKSSSSKVTSKAVASKASAALRDGRSSARTRSLAASALAQARGTKK